MTANLRSGQNEVRVTFGLSLRFSVKLRIHDTENEAYLIIRKVISPKDRIVLAVYAQKGYSQIVQHPSRANFVIVIFRIFESIKGAGDHVVEL